MASHCVKIAEYTERFGASMEALENDSAYKDATAMCILQIGELAGHLSNDFRAAYPEMPWQAMKAMRNVAAHRYGKFDVEMLWGTITKNIPVLHKFCEDMILQDQMLQQDCIEEPEEQPEQTSGPEMTF
jgi:uncharacterized protein with HEPN domain